MFACVSRWACILIGSLSLLLGGCSNYIFEKFDIDGDGQSLSVDAKQRLVLVTHEGGKSRDRKIVCAEPSPDALSATAAAASGAIALPGLGGGGDEQGGNASAARGETVASVAMRTQTIQLLRDGLYRACEAYLNGAIDQHQYNIILLNIDKLMVVLLGVDGIAGTQNVAPVAINASANTSATAPANNNPPNTNANTSGGPKIEIKDVKIERPGVVQSEAIANIVMAANAQTAIPSLCVSLLASGELRADNPGQQTILKRCDYLLNGLFHKAKHAPPRPNRDSYEVSGNAAAAAHP